MRSINYNFFAYCAGHENNMKSMNILNRIAMRLKCLGCGMCAQICPEGIKMSSGIPKIYNKRAKCIEEAARLCPKHLIITNGK